MGTGSDRSRQVPGSVAQLHSSKVNLYSSIKKPEVTILSIYANCTLF